MPLDDPTTPTPDFLQGRTGFGSAQAEQGFQNAQATDLNNLKIQEARVTMQQNALAFQRQQVMRKALAEATVSPSSAGFIKVAAMFPEVAKAVEPLITATSAQEKQALVFGLAPALAASVKGDAPNAIAQMEHVAKSVENSGRGDIAQGLRAMIPRVQQDTKNGILGLGMMLTSMDPTAMDSILKGATAGSKIEQAGSEATKAGVEARKEVVTEDLARPIALAGLGKTRAETSEAGARTNLAVQQALEVQQKILDLQEVHPTLKDKALADIKAQVAAANSANASAATRLYETPAKVKLDLANAAKAEVESQVNRQKLTNLPEDLRPDFTKSVMAGSDSHQFAIRALGLENDLRNGIKGVTASGLPATIANVWRKVAGNESSVDVLRAEANQLLDKVILNGVALGHTNETLIGMKKAEVLSSITDPKTLADFIHQIGIEHANQEHLHVGWQDWLNNNRDPGNAHRDFMAGGVQVHKNDGPGEFLSRISGPTQSIHDVDTLIRAANTPGMDSAKRQTAIRRLRALGVPFRGE